MIKMGLIGCGTMSGAYLRQMEPLANRIIFTGLVDIDRERAEAAKKSTSIAGTARTGTRPEEIFDVVDALIIATPHDLHRDMAVDSLEAGKHVLIEKPMANSERQCLDIIEAAEKSRCIAMHGYVMRYAPLVREYCRMIREKRYGECFHFSIWTEQYTDLSRGNWLGQSARCGGGQLFSHGCHYIDILLYCLGAPVCGTHVGTNKGTPWMEMEGTSNVCIKFENGTTGYHFGTWGSRGSKLRYSMHAHCTGGMLELDYSNGDIRLWLDHTHGDLGGMSREELSDPANRPRSRVLSHREPGEKTTGAEIEHFLDCIESGSRPETDLYSGMQGLRVIWRLYEAERREVVADLRGLALDAYSPNPDPFLSDRHSQS